MRRLRSRAVEHDDEYARVVDRVDDAGRIVAHHVARRVPTAYTVRLEHRANVFDDGAHTVFVTQKYIGFFHIFTSRFKYSITAEYPQAVGKTHFRKISVLDP